MVAALRAPGVERRLTPSMADVRARRDRLTAANDVAEVDAAAVSDVAAVAGGGSAANGVPSDAEAGGRTTSESQVVARSILERGRRSHGLHLDRLEEMALDARPLPRESAPDSAASRGPLSSRFPPPGAPPPEEFLRLFNEYERYVASIGSRILGANNGVDDLVQEVFLVIYQEFHKLRELSSVKAWLATIATRVAWRQRGRPWLYSKLSLTQVEELNPLESTDASPELQADLATLLDRLRSMPASLREPWLLRFIDGETLPRIAELCDCSQSTVQRRLREAGEVMLGEKAPSSSTS
jgi:RNA polymerase sigma-70 factor, ECF subfamily